MARSHFGSVGDDLKQKPLRAALRTTVIGALAALGALAWSGCGTGSEGRYYCDGDGCYECDAYGCAPVTPPTKVTCTGASSCPPGSVCTEIGCTTTCSAEVPCAKGEVCQGGLCAAPGTSPGTPKDCTTKADCQGGETCNAGTCEACGGDSGPCPCTEASDCQSGQVCTAGACTAATNTCTYSSECEGGKVCADGRCLTSCDSVACEGGFTCEKGVCQPTTGGCVDSGECQGETSLCVQGACVAPCSGEGECAEGRYCDQGACVVDTRPTPNCTNDAQCGGSTATPRRCLGGFCKYTCAANDDAYCRTIDSRIGFCAADLVCRSAAEANAQCTRPADCEGGKSCIDNQCR